MSTIYNIYDYPQFWKGREYEHGSEVLALQYFLNKIPHIKRLIDIGAGYGRLTPYYIYRARRLVLTDTSAKLLKQAKQSVLRIDEDRANNVSYIQIKTQNVAKKVKNGTFDVVICVRNLHHIEDTNEFFQIIHKLLKKNGYLIIEFPNKLHGKALAKQIIRIRKTLPSTNFHPIEIQKQLNVSGFQIIERRSVSNIRSSILKKYLTVPILLVLEKILQRPFSHILFGPSIFILAKKRG